MSLFLNICAMKTRKKLIFFSTCEGRTTDHHFLIPNRVENLVYPYERCWCSLRLGHEMVGPQELSCPLTSVVPRNKRRVHQVDTPGGTCLFESIILRKETFAYHIFCSMFLLFYRFPGSFLVGGLGWILHLKKHFWIQTRDILVLSFSDNSSQKYLSWCLDWNTIYPLWWVH